MFPGYFHQWHMPYMTQAEQEGLSASTSYGTPHAIDEDNLRFLQDDSIGPHSYGWRPVPRPISRRAALEYLESTPARSNSYNLSASRIFNAVRQPAVGYDLAIKLFCDLDKVLFHGELRRRVNLRWATSYDGYLPFYVVAGNLLGCTMPADHQQPRVAIRLNCYQDWIELGPWEIIGTLVHEMVHAWYMIMCGEAGLKNDHCNHRGMDKHHGTYFWDAAKHVRAKLVECVQYEGAKALLADALTVDRRR